MENTNQEARIDQLEEEKTELIINTLENIPECPVIIHLYFPFRQIPLTFHFSGLSRPVQERSSHLQLPRWSSHLWSLQGQEDQGKTFVSFLVLF